MIRLFKHYIPLPLIILSLVEIFILLLSVQGAIEIRFTTLENSKIESITGISSLFCFVIVVCLISMGLYQRHLRDGARGMFVRICVAFVIAFVAMSLLFYLFPSFFLGRGVLAIAFLISFLGVVLSRFIYINVVDGESLNRRVLVLGVGQKAKLIDELLKRRSDRRGFVIVGYLALNEEISVIDLNKTVPYDTSLIKLVEELDVDEIVLAVNDRRDGFPVDELLDCKMSGIDVVDVQSFFERQAGRIILNLLQPSWLIFSDGFAQGAMRDIVKRIFDITVSLVLLVFALPIMLATAIIIYLEDRGPVFYQQVRVGKNWKLVSVMKFRSMRTDAEKNGVQFAQKNDNRITKTGYFIRRTRIDELPQLINVLRGDMSFVGPRPERPEFVEEFAESIPFYSERHRVKPGITGWAQICYPYGDSEKDTVEKLQYDLYYVKNYSIFLDLTVIFQTAEVILWGKGAR